ncbi:MAG: hypothetical protein JWN83_1550 [Chitinophagaceae bacterium]|nr:hypothetical protein [Chitinophagaceae bacterium]
MCKKFLAIRALSFLIFAHFEDKINLLSQEKFGSNAPVEMVASLFKKIYP